MYQIKAAIVDDETTCIESLESFLHKYSFEKDIQFLLDSFSDPSAFQARFDCRYDLVFLDILMPHLSGMDLAKEIRSKDPDVMIVFITSSTEYAIGGYAVNAYDYIVKPLNFYEFSMKMDRILVHLKEKVDRKGSIVIKSENGLVKLNYADIIYIESRKHNVVFHTREGDYMKYSPIKNIYASLPKDLFVQFNSGYVANLFYVDKIDGDSLVLRLPDREITLPVSRARKKETLSKLMDYSARALF